MNELVGDLYFAPVGTPEDILKLIAYLYEKDYLRVADLNVLQQAHERLFENDDKLWWEVDDVA